MTHARVRMLGVAVALAITAGLGACGGPSDSYDCNEACNLYQDCVDSEYDTATCETRCESMAGSSSTYGAQATACHNCLATPACLVDAGETSTTFPCADTCTGVVP